MTLLEKSVADALRLSEKGAEKLNSVIRRHIRTARAELIRAGVPKVLAESDHPLVEDAIVTFCMYKMDDEDEQEKHWQAFEYQEDTLRKSTISLEEAETGE